ncbi:glycerol-3-phosphate dehydrogenase [Spongorhabdus nitratireducens]
MQTLSEPSIPSPQNSGPTARFLQQASEGTVEGAMPETALDLLVIGGGINGTGIARDAAGRGLSVLLCEQSDLASATSSASSKLIHGGLRYLEHHEFRLVSEALKEREVLLGLAPHLVKPMRFILPHAPHLRPAWMIRIGLFLYDFLARRKTLPGSKGLKFNDDSPLKPAFRKGFEYSDCWVDDARLVVSNAIDIAELGGTVLNRTRCVSAVREAEVWKVTLEDCLTSQQHTVYSKGLVNAAGPWVAKVINNSLQQKSRYGIRLIKGSHIIVPRMHKGDRAYILQNKDRRIVFVIPYLENHTVIGTTDVEYQGDPSDVTISAEETQYLLDVVNDHFRTQLETGDIVSSYSGVRPLCDDESNDPSAITRDYTVTVEDMEGHTPLLNVFGGKLTTYRKLGEAALEQLRPYYPWMQPKWTATEPLPGGDLGTATFGQFLRNLKRNYHWLPPHLCRQYATRYGKRCLKLLENTHSLNDLGDYFGGGLYAREIDYLVRNEWAMSADDILWRRTKAGLEFSSEQKAKLEDYLKHHHSLE